MDQKGLWQQQFYNATLEKVKFYGKRFALFTIKPDEEIAIDHAGQFIQIGLGGWESRLEGCQKEVLDEKHYQTLGKRLYSISLDPREKSLAPDKIELFISLLPSVANGKAPFLTPRLFNMQSGDRLFCAAKAAGHYSTTGLKKDDDILFVSTGTGIAPHNAMASELLHQGHKGRIIITESQFEKEDCPYEEAYRELEQKFTNLNYLPFINGSGKWRGKFLQDFFKSGEFEKQLNWAIDKNKCQVFICGGPLAIAAPRFHRDIPEFPHENGLVQLFQKHYGLELNHDKKHSAIHWESFWNDKN